MTSTETTIKIIEKAVKSGYNPIPRLVLSETKISVQGVKNDRWSVWFYDEDGTGYCLSIPQIIFSHDFAKAFWSGEKRVWVESFRLIKGEYSDKHKKMARGYFKKSEVASWHYHLQKMVLKENPLDYLARFLDESQNPSNDR